MFIGAAYSVGKCCIRITVKMLTQTEKNTFGYMFPPRE